MCACIQHYENKFLVVLLPDKKPIRLYVAFPLTFSVAVKKMRQIFIWEFSFNGKDAYGFTEQVHIIASPFAQLQLTLELSCKSNRVHL